jgi:glutamate formiminotransferase
VVDVVPFVPLGNTTFEEAIHERDAFAQWAAKELGVPSFYYGPERTLPDIRRTAWTSLFPDVGPRIAHPTAGAMCVGVREVLVAYNIFLTDATMETAREIVLNIRQPGLRALSFLVDGHAQISMNLTDIDAINVDTAYDIVAQYGNIARAELVGLMPLSALTKIEPSRWSELEIGVDKTIEARFDTLLKVQ